MHPLRPEDRNVRRLANGIVCNLEYGKPITIGNNCWLGANMVVCGGVTIGDGCVIGAGSVVTRNVPPSSLAAGNPCRVIRALTEADRIIIDTLLMITPPMSDSPYANDYNNIVALKKFADKYEIAIVLIHHTRKLKAKDPFDEILGTSGLNGAADTMMILTREGRSESRGTLRYTGRDIGDEEINLEFHDGDWRITEEAEDTSFVGRIIDLVGDKTHWEGTATNLAEATGGDIAPKWMTRKLNEHRAELEARGIDFLNERESSNRRNIKIVRKTEK